ncbi:MAG: hypothetical protein QM736_27160 [Vicinamibacterales bacterium]
MRKLTRFRLRARMQGDGFVTDQDPLPGTPVTDGSVCRLTLARAIARPVSNSRTP